MGTADERPKNSPTNMNPRQLTMTTTPTSAMTTIATIDSVLSLPPPEAGPAEALPGRMLIPHFGQTRTVEETAGEHAGRKVTARHAGIAVEGLTEGRSLEMP